MSKLNLILGLLIASPVFASPFKLPNLRDKMPKAAATQPSGECVDFSGSWKGTCTRVEGSDESTLNIEQFSCESIMFDAYSYEIGGSVSETQVSQHWTLTASIHVDWNTAKDQLIGSFDGNGRALQGPGRSHFDGNMQMRKNGETLVTEQTSTLKSFNPDGTLVYEHETKEHCTYEKQ